MKTCILDTERQIKQIGGKVVFATIATSSKWNFHRYSIYKTDVLKFYEDYDEMQDRLHSVLREINQFITELNSKNNMVTPFLHTYVHKKKGGKIKYMFSKLVDVVHPTMDLSISWFKHMEKVVSENEKNLVVMDSWNIVRNSYITEICLAYLWYFDLYIFCYILLSINVWILNEFPPCWSSWVALAAFWFDHVGSSYSKWFDN